MDVTDDTLALYSFSRDSNKYSGKDRRLARNQYTLLVFHPTELPSLNFNIELYKKLISNVKNPEKIINTANCDNKLIAAIPFMPLGYNQIPMAFLKSPYRKFLSKTLELEKSFINIKTIVFPDQS